MLKKNGSEVIADLDLGAYVFVCGGTLMGGDVMEALTTILVEHKKMTKEQATEHVKDMQKSGRYVQELWSSG